MKIKELQLHNFKFFTDTDNILNFDSKNVLIWGENGSGKSSIYWSIYTLLQCSYKDNVGIDAYFTHGHDKSLRNIFARKNGKSFVKMTLDNGSSYRIGFKDYSAIGDANLQLSSISTDFIDYKVVASFLNFWHKEEPDVYPVFEGQILGFLSFAPPAPFSDEYFDEALNTILKGPPQDTTNKKYSTKGAPAYDQYVKLVEEFNRQFKETIGLVNIEANKLLKDKEVFNYDLEIELTYEPLSFNFNGARTEIRFTKPIIILQIPSYYGRKNSVKRPHSFLNEAKKTAIGLAIRLGILKRRLLADKLNVLALDDLLISLDMSNREVVLKLLFEEYQNNYQLLIFTHDKQFFNIAKNKIENAPFKDDWLFWEFYVNDKDIAKPKPKFFETKSQLAIAFNHLQENDYPAAANYLRKHCEHLIETYMPQSCFALTGKDKPHKNTTLDSMLTNSIAFLDRINNVSAKAQLVLLRQYVEMLLNPLSHTERGVDRHKGEIKAVIKILDNLETELKQLRFSKMPIVPLNTDLFLTLLKDANNTFKIQIRLKEDLFVYDDGVVKLSKCLTDSVTYWHYETGQPDKTGDYTFHSNKDIAVSYNDISGFATIAVPTIPNWETLFTKADGTALDTLMVL